MATKSLGTLTVDMLLQTAGFEAGFNKAERIADQKTRQIERQAKERAKAIESAFGNIGGAIAGAFAGLQIAQFAKQIVDMQGRLEDLSKSTQISVTNLAGLDHAARLSGSNLDSVASAVNKLSVNMGKNAEKFAKLGVTSKDPVDALGQLADILNGIEDPQKRAAVAAEALSKGWQELAPLLSEGSRGIRALVDEGTNLSGVTEENNKRAAEFGDNLEKLKTGSYGLANSIINPLLPALNDLITRFNEAAKAKNVFGWAISSGNEEDNAAERLGEITAQLYRMRKMRDELSQPTAANKLNDLIFGDVRDLNAQISLLEKKQAHLQTIARLQAKGISDTPPGPATSSGAVDGFLAGSTPSAAKAISEGQRLVDQMRQRLMTAQDLSAVERLQIELSEKKYSKITDGERAAALALAAQIDHRADINRQLDEEINAVRELSKVYEQQEARLKQMIGNTDSGKNLQRMQDEALAEGALMSGKIDTATYDQIIAKLREVKDEGKDAFAELQQAIEGWGKASADAFVEFAFTGKASFSDMATSILKDMAKMVVYQNVTKPMAQGISAWLPGLFASANGNVFESPSLHQYVNTVQTTPKLFAFAQGGVFAEAGPEAVMPLARDGQGRLGVRSDGGSPNINVTVNNSVADQAEVSVQPRMNNGQLEIDVLIQRAISKDQARNGPITQGFANTFGLARSA